ncbi:MAG: outer membrane protein assembly factor BamD [Bdellovibrionota bacterium]
MFKKSIFCSLFLLVVASCSEKEFDPNDSEKSYLVAKEPYDDENYEIALTKLAEFKARFPYSKYAIEAELLIANSHFQLGQFTEAAVAYEQFAKLHPKHPKVDFALYRVGASYWADAPEEIDREQEYTAKSIEKWEKLVSKYPNSQYSKLAKDNIKDGRLRIAKSEEFVAKFYCKQEIWHACAHRNLKIADKYGEYKDIQLRAALAASSALEKLAKQKTEQPDSDKNLYFKNMSAKQLLEKARSLKDKASK